MRLATRWSDITIVRAEATHPGTPHIPAAAAARPISLPPAAPACSTVSRFEDTENDGFTTEARRHGDQRREIALEFPQLKFKISDFEIELRDARARVASARNSVPPCLRGEKKITDRKLNVPKHHVEKARRAERPSCLPRSWTIAPGRDTPRHRGRPAACARRMRRWLPYHRARTCSRRCWSLCTCRHTASGK